jgi:hypothetical protein
MSTPTKEEIDKQILRHKQMGFINHTKAAGHADEVVRSRHAKYLELDAARTKNLEDFRTAIVG